MGKLHTSRTDPYLVHGINIYPEQTPIWLKSGKPPPTALTPRARDLTIGMNRRIPLILTLWHQQGSFYLFGGMGKFSQGQPNKRT